MVARRVRRFHIAVPGVPDGYVTFQPTGKPSTLLPMQQLSALCAQSMLLNPAPTWRDDPSYDWAKKTAAKKRRKLAAAKKRLHNKS
jgi:hypothetical protein